MFDLDKAVAEWRRQMRSAGVKHPDALNELESHLREEIGRQMARGKSGPRALEIAVHEIGRPDLLKNEFGKIERNYVKKTLIILLGIFGILFGPAILLPALALHRHAGIWTADMIVPVTLGIL